MATERTKTMDEGTTDCWCGLPESETYDGYEVYIVVVDRKYPFTCVEDPHDWEGGWYGWVGRAGDHQPAQITDYDTAIAVAEELSVAASGFVKTKEE